MSRKPTQLIPAPKEDPLLAKRRKKNLTEKKVPADSPDASANNSNSDDATSPLSSPSQQSEQQDEPAEEDKPAEEDEPAEEERPRFDKSGRPIKPHAWLSQRCGSRYSELDRNHVITGIDTLYGSEQSPKEALANLFDTTLPPQTLGEINKDCPFDSRFHPWADVKDDTLPNTNSYLDVKEEAKQQINKISTIAVRHMTEITGDSIQRFIDDTM